MKIKLILICFYAFFSCNNSLPITTINDSQDTIRVKKGEPFIIQLESSFGNGYKWDIAEALDETIVTLDSIRFKKETTNDAEIVIGEKPLVLFHFHTLDKGTTNIKFIQFRPWEKDTPKDSSLYKLIVVD